MDDNERIEQNGQIESTSQEKGGRRFSRRKFLIKSGIVVAGSIASLLVKERERVPDVPDRLVGLPHGPSLTEISSPIERVEAQMREKVANPFSEVDIDHELGAQGLRVFVDKNGAPIKFVTRDGGEKFFGRDKVIAAREKAARTQEPELIAAVEMLPVEREVHIDRSEVGTPEHPLIYDLPADVLSNEELRSRGVEIIQGDNVSLHMRQSAFREDGVLFQYPRGGSKLLIVLVNGPIVDQYFMQGSRYDSVRDLIQNKQDSKKARKSEIEYVGSQIEYLKRLSITHQDSHVIVSLNLQHLARAKAYLYAYEHLMPDAQVSVAYNSKKRTGADVRGRYFSDQKIVFSCVGEAELNTDLAWFYYLPDGTFDFSWILGDRRPYGFFEHAFLPIERYGFIGSTLRGDSHPDPNKIPINFNARPDDPKSYPYHAVSPGFVLRHELAHAELVSGNPKKPNTSEYDTDMRAMSGLKNAWTKWEESGYKDDRGYDIVFKTPVGDYILT